MLVSSINHATARNNDAARDQTVSKILPIVPLLSINR